MKKLCKTCIALGLMALMVGCSSIEVDKTSESQMILDVEPELLVLMPSLETLDKAYTE